LLIKILSKVFFINKEQNI